ncbi:type II toxin-antitoxin system PemK/MazF family toxin [Clostridium perfringens]|uniref:type II toxin-antitoxin system PemK/MazF family toxin n=1 Tax=Clostridium perfringens TaxID=1502 RepID=UPI0018E41FA6|nr:type II toxin-antitoxin system PemK/MazF family toxin [Clostridium perfringens]MBI6006009.1 type II toxin-antitoxin system PemK/MazF family toxin [Clostridium perfringens]
MRIKHLNTDEEIRQTLRQVLDELECNIVENLSTKQQKILTYWLNDWNENFLSKEQEFNPKQLIKYKKGNIVKVHLGYNISSEQGGLHYGLVMDNNNNKNSNVITIIPIRSLEDYENEETINERFEVYLGKALLTDKIDYTKKELQKIDRDLECTDTASFQFSNLKKRKDFLLKELKKLNKGSIAIVSQIRTISKMRIYEPINSYQSLSKFVLDDYNMKKVEDLFLNLYIKSVDKS